MPTGLTGAAECRSLVLLLVCINAAGLEVMATEGERWWLEKEMKEGGRGGAGGMTNPQGLGGCGCGWGCWGCGGLGD